MSGLIDLIAVVGPTASGKSALAVELAKKLDGEVVSCDSMQLYRGMDIAVAAPTKDEMQGIPHHLIAVADPTEEFSVAKYCELAHAIIADIAARGKMPILCGGTGLYYESVVDNISFASEQSDKQLREDITQRVLLMGGGRALEYISGFDPETAARLEANDTRRIVRAIEIYELTGMTMSEHLRASRKTPCLYRLCAIGLDCSDRAVLYEKINTRVDVMVARGLVDEARVNLASAGATSSQAIGHKELAGYFDKTASLEECLDSLRQSTRRYAKRQLSWFRRDKRIKWIYTDIDKTPLNTALEYAAECFGGEV